VFNLLLPIGVSTTVLLALEVAYNVHMQRNSASYEREAVSLMVAATSQEEESSAVAYREIMVG
jgi:hypothetical protein